MYIITLYFIAIPTSVSRKRFFIRNPHYEDIIYYYAVIITITI